MILGGGSGGDEIAVTNMPEYYSIVHVCLVPAVIVHMTIQTQHIL